MPEVDEVGPGDIVGYGLQPNEVIRRAAGDGRPQRDGQRRQARPSARWTCSCFNPDAARAIDWTDQGDRRQRARLPATLPEVRRDGELTAVHGSPRDPTCRYITGPDVASADLRSFDTRICLHGHTHVPIVFRAGEGAGEAVSATPEMLVTDPRRAPRCSTRRASASRATAIRPSSHAVIDIGGGAALSSTGSATTSTAPSA